MKKIALEIAAKIASVNGSSVRESPDAWEVI
jgi:hypothetical protein